MIESYKQLIIWQKSIDLAENIYRATALLPQSELYGLTSQMRRCAISIPSNIAEGYKRRSLGDYVRFLTIADGSAAELETQIILAGKLYPDSNFSKAKALLEEIQKMFTTLIKKLKSINTTAYCLNLCNTKFPIF